MKTYSTSKSNPFLALTKDTPQNIAMFSAFAFKNFRNYFTAVCIVAVLVYTHSRDILKYAPQIYNSPIWKYIGWESITPPPPKGTFATIVETAQGLATGANIATIASLFSLAVNTHTTRTGMKELHKGIRNISAQIAFSNPQPYIKPLHTV